MGHIDPSTYELVASSSCKLLFRDEGSCEYLIAEPDAIFLPGSGLYTDHASDSRLIGIHLGQSGAVGQGILFTKQTRELFNRIGTKESIRLSICTSWWKAANTVLDDNLLRVLAENNNRDVDALSLTSVGLKSDGIRLLNQWDWPRLERLDLSIAWSTQVATSSAEQA